MKGTSEGLEIAVAADFDQDRVWILGHGIDAFSLDESDMREFAAALVRACDELAGRRKARTN